ncbi:MAG TPA: AraC family ligand binding domain-containing protein, partial [Cytophagales bacterium]|nr:AraC family ligand binding domain-containing protein [Cytophagales bacterium]
MSHIPIRQITELEASESFKIRDIKTLLSEKDMEQDLHRHDFFFVLALEKGLGEHVIDFTSYLIDDYSVFFMKPGQVHQLTLRQGSTGYLMEFNADFYRPFELPAKQVLQKVSNKTHCQLDAARFNKILSVLAYIFEEYTERRDRYTEIIKAYMSIFFTELYR